MSPARRRTLHFFRSTPPNIALRSRFRRAGACPPPCRVRDASRRGTSPRPTVLFWLLALSVAQACTQPVAPREKAVPVTVAPVVTGSMPLEVEAVGTVEAEKSVSLRAQVSGLLLKVGFEEGQEVRAGQVLFQIDPRPYAIQLQQALSVLERDRLQATNADAEAGRYESLVQKNYVTPEQYEKLKTSSAAYKGILGADQAAVDKARLDLEYCTLRASLSGRTGSLLVKAGNLVRASDAAPLVVIHQLDPILVRFAVGERELPAIRKRQSQGPLAVSVLLSGQTGPLSGTLRFIDNAVDTTTGTIALKARFANQDRALWPGQFASVRLHLDTQADVLVIPSPAIQTGQKGAYVFVVGADNTASVRPITTGRSADGLIAVEQGLSQGEQVVVDGQLRLVQGSKVELKPAPEPPARGPR